MASFRADTQDLWTKRNPGLDTSPMEVVGHIKALTSLLDRAVHDIYAAAELTSAEVELLVPLRYSECPVTAIRLAERLGMSRAGVGKVLTRLERRKLIKRVPHPDDRRASLITMTAAGAEIVDDVFPRELAEHARLLVGLGNNREEVLAALRLLTESIESALS